LYKNGHKKRENKKWDKVYVYIFKRKKELSRRTTTIYLYSVQDLSKRIVPFPDLNIGLHAVYAYI
jgi:hypothetical protein